MDKMTDLKALLKHDVYLLCSMEEQIVEAMPAMIAKASNPALKQALEQHLEVTKNQRDRVNRVREMLGADEDSVKDYASLLSALVGGGAKCKGIEGVIDEGEKVMAEHLSDEVMDAAIIGGAQKIEHYEISSYGTARTFAQQLGLAEVGQLLQQTLDEEYQADQQLTTLAVNSVNLDAEVGANA